MSAMRAFSLPGPKAPQREAARSRPAPAYAHVAGIEATLDASGALWWAAEETLVVSDLHLETGSSYARTGQMLPPYDTAATLARLAEVSALYRPRRIISLGDSFHDPFGPERLSSANRGALRAAIDGAQMVWISGNHDHGCAEALGGTVCDALTVAGVTFRHIPQEGEPAGREVAGHLHPAAMILIKGRTVKRRAFIGCARRLVMPAFGALTGGHPLTADLIAALWPEARPRAFMIGREKVYAV